jgi:hypothetical protein
VVFLADLDQEPYSRKRGLLIGAAIAIPVTLAVGVFVLPRIRAAIINAAADHDARARERDAYMQALCTEALVVDRDEDTCKCILGTEYPSMDCMSGFNVWLVDRQVERCADEAVFNQSVAFCTCVRTLGEQFAAEPDPNAARVIKSEGYPRCEGLDDALEYPALEQLAPSFQGG